MNRWEVTITEPVTYRTVVEAETEDEARVFAMEDHQDGIDTEVDNGPAEVESVREVR